MHIVFIIITTWLMLFCAAFFPVSPELTAVVAGLAAVDILLIIDRMVTKANFNR